MALTAALIIALQMLFGSSAAQKPTSAQIQQASIVVQDQNIVY